MASSSITLVNIADANIVYSQVGSTSSGASFRDVTRDLSVPRSLEFKNILGAPGSKGNDKLQVTLSDSAANSLDGSIATIYGTLSISVPRNSAVTSAMVTDMLAQFASLLTDARCANIADAVVP